MSNASFRGITLSAIILSGILLYINTLNFPQFMFDGNMVLLNNPFFKELEYYAKLFDIQEFSSLDENLGLNPDVTTSFMMRPVAYITFSINYLISGFNPAAFRSVNIIIHILNSLLVFSCIELLLNSMPSDRTLSSYSSRFIPTVSAFVFLLHPMQTESVTYITQRFASLAAFFYLSTIWLYLLWNRQQSQGKKRGYLRWVSVVVLLLGMLTRESLFTAPIMIILLEITVLGNGLKTVIKRTTPHLMLLPVIPVMVILVSAAQNNSPPTLSSAINIINYYGTPISSYALSQLVIVVTYLRLYLLPYGQNVDPDPQLFTHPYHWQVICSAIILFFMTGYSLYLYIKNRNNTLYVMIFFGVGWYLLALAVSSSFIPLPDLMAEHRAYLPSVGFILALICVIDLMRTRLESSRVNRVFVIGVSAWCVLLYTLTYNRNMVWQSPILLWSDAVLKSPAKERPWINLGAAYGNSGNFLEASKCFLKVIEIKPDWSPTYEMLADSYLQLKRYQDAVDISLRGIDVDPANPVIYNNLGIAYSEMGKDDDARQAFSTAIALQPGYKNAMMNLDRLESFVESKIGRQR
ncbi:MAG: tetratricopeptide repeat protein [Geobacteraceae bacterium]|nr:tetratricopeptide repeat protein [Geobacteraceae bacterium]